MKKVLMKSWKRGSIAGAVLLICFGLIQELNAQGRANVWYFGTKTGLNFSTVPPTTLSDGAINNLGVEGEGSSSISDAAGNLLFYSNGVNIWTRTHATMPNGTGLLGDVSSTQSAVIIPRPGSTTQYYLFTAPATNTANRVRWNLIDMTLNAGNGDIATPVASNKNQIMPSSHTYMMEALTVVPHFNGTDYWVIAHRAADQGSANSTNMYYVWPVTAGGIGAAQTYNVGYALPSVFSTGCGCYVSQGQGIIKSNTCFTKLFTSYYAQGAAGSVDMVNFNNSTGVITAGVSITNFEDPNRVYGIEVSPNDTYLYVTQTGESNAAQRRLYQFDVSSGVAATINASRYTVASAFNFQPSATSADRIGELQLGPDGKIYLTLHQWNVIGSGGYAQLAAIQQPNLDDAACSYNEDEVVWTTANVGTTMGLPQFTKSFVGGVANAMADKTSICAGQTVNFSYTYTGTRVTVNWDIDNNGSSNYSTDAPSHVYATAGSYWSKVTITDNCGRTAKDSILISVKNTAAPTGAISCSGNTMTMSSSHANCANFKWYKRVTSGATYDSLMGTGCTVNINYPVVSAAPSSVWVEDATGETANTTAATAPTANYPHNTTTTTFTVANTIRLVSVRYKHNTDNPNCNTNNTITIRLGATIVFQRTFNSGTVAYCNPADIPVDLTLSPGVYTIQGSRADGETLTSFTNPTIPGVITVNTDGPFFNFVTTTTALCPNRVQVNRLCSLPVVLIDFSGKRADGAVKLSWITSSELNNSHFVVERSADGIHYAPIGTIDGAGTSASVHYYTFDDVRPLTTISYYRLVQYDTDGHATEVGVIDIPSEDAGLLIRAYPNPFTHGTGILIISEEATVALKLLDLNGKLIFENKYFPANQLTELGAELASGVYVVQATSLDQNKNLKLVKE